MSSWTRVQRTQLGPELLAKQVVTPLCGINFSDHANMHLYLCRVYWVLSIGRIHQTPHLAYVFLLSVIRRSHGLVILSCIDHLAIYSVLNYTKLQIGHCIQLAQSFDIMFRLVYLFSFLFNHIFFCFYSILHARYLQILTHTCATSSCDVDSVSQHPQIPHRSIYQSHVQQIPW